jgi:predicted N-acetyltransferase YhbS
VIVLRDGTPADIDVTNAVWSSTQSDIGPDPLPEQPLALHEIRTGRLIVAEVDGEIVGFGATLTRSGVLYLADLFVRPDHQDHGIGGRLAHALCAGHHGPSFTFASGDPRAQALYARLGMPAVEPYYYLRADAGRVQPWRSDVELVEAPRRELLDLDLAVTGRNRAVDVDYQSANGATWFLACRRQRPIGVVGVAPMWWSPWHPHGARVGPVLVLDPADLSMAMSAAVDAARHLDPEVDAVTLFISSGSSLLAELLGAGFEIDDTDLLMASQRSLIDSSRYVPTVDTP